MIYKVIYADQEGRYDRIEPWKQGIVYHPHPFNGLESPYPGATLGTGRGESMAVQAGTCAAGRRIGTFPPRSTNISASEGRVMTR